MLTSNIDARLQRARVRLLLSQPFFGALCLRLKLEAAADIPTMATDGQRILFSPEFVLALSPEELEGTLAHEVMHCALGHHCRRGERDAALWNRAADLAINPLLIANGFTLPAGALIEAAFANLSAEEIYQKLERRRESELANEKSEAEKSKRTKSGNVGSDSGKAGCEPPQAAPQPGHGSDGDSRGKGAKPALAASARPGAFGEVLDARDQKGDPASPAEAARQQKEWSIASEQAMRAAKSCGRLAAGVERTLGQSRPSSQDWRAILRDFVVSQAPSDYRWFPPNRRFIARGLYLPSVERHGLGTVAVAVDTSGSIHPRELDKFAAEITAISEEARPQEIYVLYCDSRVQAIEQFSSGEPIRLHPRGHGGTDFRPVFSWIEEHQLDPAYLIYLTDLASEKF